MDCTNVEYGIMSVYLRQMKSKVEIDPLTYKKVIEFMSMMFSETDDSFNKENFLADFTNEFKESGSEIPRYTHRTCRQLYKAEGAITYQSFSAK